MKIYGLTASQVERIIQDIPNLAFKRLDTLGTKVPHVEVTLQVQDSHGRYAKLGLNGRHTAAACYHGHYRFLAAVYAVNPTAKVVSALATYSDAQDFRTKAVELAYLNIGSQLAPHAFEDACECNGGD